MNWIQTFPTIALLFFLWAELEQLRLTVREKTVRGLSLKKYVISMIINFLFGAYYFCLKHWLVLGFNTLLGIVILTIIIVGLNFKRKEEQNV